MILRCIVNICTIAIFCVFVCYRILFFKVYHKSLSEPGVSCSSSMSLVCIASFIFEQMMMMMMMMMMNVSTLSYRQHREPHSLHQLLQRTHQRDGQLPTWLDGGIQRIYVMEIRFPPGTCFYLYVSNWARILLRWKDRDVSRWRVCGWPYWARRPGQRPYPGPGISTPTRQAALSRTWNKHANQASSLIQDLEANHWIDEYSKAVLVEFNVLNPNSKLFNQVILAFEYTSDGSTLWKTNVNQVQLYRYAGSAGVVALLSEIGCAIFVLVITVIEVVKICRKRLNYFKEVWNVLQWSALILFYIAVVLYTLRCLWTVWVVEDLMNNPGNFQCSMF